MSLTKGREWRQDARQRVRELGGYLYGVAGLVARVPCSARAGNARVALQEK